MTLQPVAFRVDASPVGGKVEVAGQDVTDRVAALDLRIGQTEPTVLSLHEVPGTGVIEGAGIVRVIAEGQSPAEVVCEFLATVDPRQLEQDCLSDASCSPFAAVLSVLCHYARNEGL